MIGLVPQLCSNPEQHLLDMQNVVAFICCHVLASSGCIITQLKNRPVKIIHVNNGKKGFTPLLLEKRTDLLDLLFLGTIITNNPTPPLMLNSESCMSLQQ